MESDATEDRDPSRGRRKATLVCQACGHESPVRGDWTWAIDGDDVVVACPSCGHELTRRPAGEAPADARRCRSRC